MDWRNLLGHRPIYFANVTVLNPIGVSGHSVRVVGSRIAAIDGPLVRGDVVVDGRGGLLLPGLLNAHDHLELNTFARLKYRERYTHSLQWIEDIEARFDTAPELTAPRREPLADRLLVGACKNLLAGVTTVCHHNPLYRSLRYGYPIRVVKKYAICHSLYRGEAAAVSYRRANPTRPWIIHLAEGIDELARTEFEELAAMGAVGTNTVAVHGVGLTATQRERLKTDGRGLIWCPGSNLFLFGQTAPVGELAATGQLALGSDSRLTGEFDLLAELRVAAETGQVSPQQLFAAVTVNPARMLGLDDGAGRLIPGGLADLLLLPPETVRANLFASLLNLPRAAIELVMLGGKPLAGVPRLQSVFEATRTPFHSIEVDGQPKLLDGRLAARLKRASVRERGVVYK